MKNNKKYFFILFAIFSLAVSAQKVDLKSLRSNVLIKRVNSQGNTKLINDADFIIQNHISLNLNWEPYKYEGNINWNINPYKNSSWLNYFYSLRDLSVLAEAYKINGNKQYIIKGKEILKSWNENYKAEELLKTKSKYIWNDHAVANRVINLIHVYNVLKDNNQLDSSTKEIIISHLIEYGNWLFDDSNYTHGNHAVMIDRALLYLGYNLVNYPKSKDWIEKAKYRFNLIMEEEVTVEGVSTENSPQYHSFIMDLLKDFSTIIEYFEGKTPTKFIELYEKMKSYLVYVLQPNLIYPFQGDTYPISVPLNYSEKYEDQRLNYVESRGREGIIPENLDVVYEEAGYAILREKWGKHNEFENSTYLNFISGVPSKVHKHSDNLSFSLFSNGENILVDPGSWGYASNDTVSYLASTKAHNTFTINDENIYDFPKGSAKIIKYKLKNNFSIVEGEFSPNPFEKFHRKLIFIKPNIIIIDDYVFSDLGINTVEQIFNLGLTLKGLDIGENSITGVFNNSKVDVIQLLEEDYDIKNYNGSETIRGIYALRAEKSIQGNQIVFQRKNDTALNFSNNTTLIRLSDDNKIEINDLNIEHLSNEMKIDWSDNLGQHQSVVIEKEKYKHVFEENIKAAENYEINDPQIFTDFGIEKFSILKTNENDYSLLIELSDNTTLEGLKKLTIGIKAYANKNDMGLLSTYSRSSGRNYDSWNIKADKILHINQQKYIYINLTTDLKKTKEFKIFLFDRKGYKRELWNNIKTDFYFDIDKKNKDEINFIKSGIILSDTLLTLDNRISIEKIIGKRVNTEELKFYIKINKDINSNILKEYKFGFHTYVGTESISRLKAYSKAKKRSYDAWDFDPEIIELNNEKYIIKTISTPINEFKKIKLFLYDRSGYKGLIGKAVEVENIEIK